MKNYQRQVSELMTANPRTIKPNTSMLEIEKIFKSNDYHHLPVVNETGQPIGIISKSDYFMLLHHFTKKKVGNYEEANRMFFRSLLAADVMTPNPVSMKNTDSIEEAIDKFLNNKFRSLLVIDEDNKCIGIITPFDLIKWTKIQNSKLVETLIW